MIASICYLIYYFADMSESPNNHSQEEHEKCAIDPPGHRWIDDFDEIKDSPSVHNKNHPGHNRRSRRGITNDYDDQEIIPSGKDKRKRPSGPSR
jgi:hypothetical protein